MNFITLFTLFQAIFATVKDPTHGSSELDLSARIQLATNHFIDSLRTLGLPHGTALTIDAADNDVHSVAFASDTARLPSATITGLLVPNFATGPRDDDLCIATEVCPLPLGLLPGLIVPSAPPKVYMTHTDTRAQRSTTSLFVLATDPTIAHQHVSINYLSIFIAVVLFFLVFVKFSQGLSVHCLRIVSTSTRRIVFRRAPIGALVHHNSAQSTIPTALVSIGSVSTNSDASVVAGTIDFTDPGTVAQLLSLISEKSSEVESLKAHIEAKDRLIDDQRHTMAHLSTELAATQRVATDRKATITNLHAQHAAHKRTATSACQKLQERARKSRVRERRTSQENKGLRADNHELQSEKAGLADDVARSKEAVHQQRQEAAVVQEALTAQLSSANTEITTLKGDILNRNTVLESLDATFTATCIALATSATANYTLQRRLCDQNRQNHALTHQFEAERTTSANLRTSLTNQHEQHVIDVSALTTAHTTVLATVQTEKAEITEQLEHTTAHLAHTEQDLTATRLESAELKAQLESERTRADNLNAHIATLKVAHAAQFKTLETALATKTDELDQALARLESLQIVLAAKSAHILELRAAGCELIDEYKAHCSGLRAAVYDAAKAAVKREQARYDEHIAKLEALIKTLEAQLAKAQSKPFTSSSDSLVALNQLELASGASYANLLDACLPAAAELATLPSFASVCAIAATLSTSLSALAEQPRNNTPVVRATASPHRSSIKSRAAALSTPKPSTAPKRLTLLAQSTRGKENTLRTQKLLTSNRTTTRGPSKRSTLA